jgi:hypothetical protein
MPTTRRDLLERAPSVALLGAIPLSLDGMTRAFATPRTGPGDVGFDLAMQQACRDKWGRRA